jgi:beta-glucanase (GH16 family)
MKKSVMASAGAAALLMMGLSLFVAAPAQAYDTTGYGLIWSDEFNGSSVDSSKWSPLNLPDNVNGSQEYYLPQNAVVSGGNLNLIGKRESFGGKSYTSGSLSSFGKFSFTYGKAVARMQLPVGQGYWPAFWMIGDHASTWPAQGELDIMESIGQNFVVGTAHWDNNGHQSSGGTSNVAVTAFHDYEMEWTPQSIIWRVDGIQYYSVSSATNAAFLAPTKYYIYLNMAIGGTWPGNPTASTVFPATTLVDYVRVYQKNGNPPPPPTTNPPTAGKACSAVYTVTNQWPGGYQASVTVTNTGTSALTGWKAAWALSNGQTVGQVWNGSLTTGGSTATVANAAYNGAVAPGANTSFGLTGTSTGTVTAPPLTCTAS